MMPRMEALQPHTRRQATRRTPLVVTYHSGLTNYQGTSLASSSHAELPSMIVALKPESEWCTFANKYSLEFLCPDTHVDVQPLDGLQHYRDYAVD